MPLERQGDYNLVVRTGSRVMPVPRLPICFRRQ